MAKASLKVEVKEELPLPHDHHNLNDNIKASFSWDDYISGTDDKPAPKACFKQTVDPPENEFRPGMKLESKDPRNSRSNCIATVIYISGPRLCLRLDGSDNRNDFWSLVDSEDIHPYGWCEAQGEQLQPPLGFAKNASCYPLFLSKLLQDSMDMMAPKSCFKPVPTSPAKNLFEVGMRLEAIDRKNPHLIGPATIGKLDGDKVYIQFDGWRGAFDYSCRYDCRDIFPVGWCAATGHALQPPGTKGNIPRMRGSSSSKSQSVSPNVAIHVETQSHSMGIPSPGSARSGGSKRNSPAVNKLTSPDHPLTSPATTSGETVTAYVNQTCRCGPLLNQTRIIRLPLQYGPSSVSRILQKIVQALVESANNPAQVFNCLVTSPSNNYITAKISGKTLMCSIPSVSTVAAFSEYVSNLLQRIECCVNMITLQPLRQICDKCSATSSGSSNTLKRANSTSNGHTPPRKSRPMRTMSVPARARGRKKRASNRDPPPVSPPPPPPPTQSPCLESLASISSASNTQPQISSANPQDWTTNEVIQYVRTKDPTLSKQAHLIQSHEIDGRSFLLLTSDIIIKYMQMKVGPALKLCSLIDQLRRSMRC